ncbi:MAG: hypothetical protein GY795_29515 [Desulfobacterales bacterium]|nr:hypothetical protein [Desulfobacterales bacterium]
MTDVMGAEVESGIMPYQYEKGAKIKDLITGYGIRRPAGFPKPRRSAARL